MDGRRQADRLPSHPTRSVPIWILGAALMTNGACGLASLGGAGRNEIEVAELSIPELQAAMSDGRVSSVDLVGAYLARIAAYDDSGPALNAVLVLNPMAATEAARFDAERAAGVVRGPLHGIPVILKDNYDMAGLPTTGGSIALANHRPTGDAFQVRKLRDAGAVIVGKANLHELAYGITTISSLGGQTLNPYDLSRNPGGSSGGTAAAVAASFAAIGWGTDTCGSIRIPASANNLWGLRPTKGLSSIDGVLPLSTSQDVAGPLARTMIDLAIGLDATIGFDPADPATSVLAGRSLPRFADMTDRRDLSGIRIGILAAYLGESPEESEVASLIRSSLAVMAGIGAEVEEVEIPGFADLLAGTSLIDLEFKWDLMEYLARTPGGPVRTLSEIVENELHHPAVAGVLQRSDRHQVRDGEAIDGAMERRAAARAAILAFMDEHRLDVLAYPSLRRPPAPIGEPGLGNNCQLSAATGFPALTVPAGFTETGVPVGLELLGRPFADDSLVGYGFAYEAVAAPRQAPPTTPPLTRQR